MRKIGTIAAIAAFLFAGQAFGQTCNQESEYDPEEYANTGNACLVSSAFGQSSFDYNIAIHNDDSEKVVDWYLLDIELDTAGYIVSADTLYHETFGLPGGDVLQYAFAGGDFSPAMIDTTKTYQLLAYVSSTSGATDTLSVVYEKPNVKHPVAEITLHENLYNDDEDTCALGVYYTALTQYIQSDVLLTLATPNGEEIYVLDTVSEFTDDMVIKFYVDPYLYEGQYLIATCIVTSDVGTSVDEVMFRVNGCEAEMVDYFPEVPTVEVNLVNVGDPCFYDYNVVLTGCAESLKIKFTKVDGPTVFQIQLVDVCDYTFNYSNFIEIYGIGKYRITATAHSTIWGDVKDAKQFKFYVDACGREDGEAATVKVVTPNPTTGVVEANFDYSGVELDNLSGYAIDTWQSGETIDFSSVPSGMYILRFFDSNHNLIHKEKVMKI